MENTEEPWTIYDPTAKVVPGTPYSPLVKTKQGTIRTPSRVTVSARILGKPTPSIAKVVFECVLRGRRYVIQRMEVEGSDSGFHLDTLKTIPLSSFLEAAIASKFEFVADDGSTYSTENPLPAPVDPLYGVAITYSAAVAVGNPKPTAAVAQEYEITPGAAAQRVRRARALGYLPPTTPGKVS